MATNQVISTAPAQQLIEHTAPGHGWISQRAPEASDEEALEAIETLQQSLGISTIKLAMNLYKSHARLVFELIRNAEDTSLQHIRTLVLNRYNEDETPSTINFETSSNHLQFLYSAYSPESTIQLRKSTSFFVFDYLYGRSYNGEDLYFQSDEEYSFEKLVGSDLDTQIELRGLLGSLIHPDYCKRIGLPYWERSGFHPPFKTWLQESIGVLSYPRLVSPKDPTQLSPIFQYIIEKCPEKLLGTLKAHWASYAAAMSTDLASSISKAVVPNTNIGPKPVKETFIPSETLLTKCGIFVDIQKFPFLKLENGTDFKGWKFLKAFHVGIEDGLDFWLQVLYYCKSSEAKFHYEIYEIIQQKIEILGSLEEDTKRVRDFIQEKGLIFVPCTESPPSWTCPSCCLWDAPEYFTSYIPLLPLLSRFNTPTLTSFFQDTLDIDDVSWVYLVDELCDCQLGKQQDLEVVRDIYLRLQDMSANMNSEGLDVLRSSFEEENLIYDMVCKRWTAPSACLWSKDPQAAGQSIISSQYSNLEAFFVEVLNVETLDLNLLVKKLNRVALSSPSIDDVKSLIWQINGSSPTSDALSPLYESKIFPVRGSNGTLEIRKRGGDGHFSIVDRQPWADAFKGKLDFLDFSLEDVRALEPFLSKMFVWGYLSEAVIEKSSFQGSRQEPNHKKTKNFQRRAYALSRCAKHFHSPRAKNDSQDLYQLFLQARVYETDGIVGTLEHKIRPETAICKASKTMSHIEESLDGLQIYIPKDSRDQEICYLRILPTKLFNETMMARTDGNSTWTRDSRAVSIIMAILTCSDEVIDMVLEEAGIVPVSFPDLFEEEYQQSPHGLGDGQQRDLESNIQSAPSKTEASAGLGTPSTQSTNFSGTASSSQHQPGASPQSIRLSGPLEIRAEPVLSDSALIPFVPGNSDPEYRRLLYNNIITARNKREPFPVQGAFNFDELRNALPVEAVQKPKTYEFTFRCQE